MALDNNNDWTMFTAIAALFTTIGTIIGKVFLGLSDAKKQKVESAKIKIDGSVLSDSEQREKNRFTEEQLTNLEKRFKDQQSENRILQQENVALIIRIKELSIKLEDAEKKTNKALSDITFLRIQLEAYRPIK
ncbi:MAG TPA: hypothetical protein VIJ57_03055 [Hanamia sp.]